MALQLGLQNALTKAQINNIEADTNKKNVEAKKTEGVDTQESLQRINLMAQQEDNARWSLELLKIDKAIGELNKFKLEQTNEWSIKGIKYEVQSALQELRSKMANANVDEQTQDAKIKEIRAAAEGQVITNALNNAKINLTNQEIEEIKTRMDVMLTELDVQWQALRIDEQEMYIKSYVAKVGAAALPMQTLVGAATSLATIRSMFPTKSNTVTTVLS